MNRRIKDIRKRSGMNQDEFAEKIGLTKNFVSLIETGSRKPSDRTLSDICRIFNVNRQWLIAGEGEMYKPSERGEQIGRIAREAATTNPEEAAAFFKDLLGRFTDEEIVLLYTIVKDKFGK